MNKKMMPYYLSRAVFAIAFGVLFFATGSPLWEALLFGGLILALFIWAPHSGRYAVHPELGVTALRRDEFTQAINDKAARNSFVALMLLIGGISLATGTAVATFALNGILRILLIAGVLVYFGSDLWMRKTKQ